MKPAAPVNVPRITLHEVRHTHASKGAENGGVDEIHPAEGRGARHVGSNRLGHKDASVTLTIYAHHIPEDSPRTLNAFTRAVRLA